MKPRLFRGDSTEFSSLGIGVLAQTISCVVTEQLGVAPTLEMSLINSDPLFADVTVGNIIACIPNKNTPSQAFIIEEITKPIDGIVTIYATHIAQHRAKLIPVAPFTASNLDEALTKMVSESMEDNPFTLVRDPGKNNVTATMHPTVPHSFRELMGGVAGSVLDTYRGEWGYDNFTITLYNKRGRDNGARVMYGRNMSDFNLEEQFNWNSSATGVIGYWVSQEDGTTVIGDIQYSENADLYPYNKTVCMDFSEKFETAPSKTDLNTYALSWINGKGLIGASVDVAYQHVNVEGGADVGIGDIVHIFNGTYNFEMESRIVGLEFDVLSEEYTNVSIGDMKTTLNEAISDIGGGSTTVGGGGASVEPSTSTPLMDGTAQVGTEQKYARGDHVHPRDTTKLDLSNGISKEQTLRWRLADGTSADGTPRIELRGANTNHSLNLVYYPTSGSTRFTELVDAYGVALYPVGAVIMTATNTNPSARYGGTWSLIDKFFTEYNSANTSLITPTNCTVSSLVVARSSQNVLIRAQIVTTVALGETAVDLFKIPYSVMGIDGFYNWQGVAWTDDGNGIAMLNGQASSSAQTVTIQSWDVITRSGGSSIASGSTFYVYIQPMIRQGNMLDSACNKFLWRRTA